MKKIAVRLGTRSYTIIIGNKISSQIGKVLLPLRLGQDAYIITNAYLKRAHAKKIEKSLKSSGFTVKFRLIPDTERSKSIENVFSIIKDISSYATQRRIFIAALGGGVVGDLAGFIAAVYKRGVPYLHIPTTLLAQVDSSIGGKTGINLMEGKNLVGVFYQPRLVFTDTAFLNTLDMRQMRSGMAEIIKYGIIKDPALFSFLEKNYKKCLQRDPMALEYIISRCAKIKADIVGKDEREKKMIRTVLNFGHTIGHALESAAHYQKLNHGESVALGMLAAADISLGLGLIDTLTKKRIEVLIRAVGLPCKVHGLKTSLILSRMRYDKKFFGARNRLVLLKGIGRTEIVEKVPSQLIVAAIKKVAS